MAIDVISLQKNAPELVSLAKATAISLEKNNLTQHKARVALVLDVSGSMAGLYESGAVDRLVKRALPVALGFDDNQEIDVFAFGTDATEIGGYTIRNYKQCVTEVLEKTHFSGTRYHTALDILRNYYRGTTQPVYVMFVTDGDTSNKEDAKRLVQEMSKEPIFLQFIGLGADKLPATMQGASKPKEKGGFLGRMFSAAVAPRTPFEFLEDLDSMDGRVVDNANFFAMKTPDSHDDAFFYELLMNEYPQWLEAAKAKGILR